MKSYYMQYAQQAPKILESPTMNEILLFFLNKAKKKSYLEICCGRVKAFCIG